MIRITIDIDNSRLDLFATKETIAMALEPFGNVRIVSIVKDGKEQK